MIAAAAYVAVVIAVIIFWIGLQRYLDGGR